MKFRARKEFPVKLTDGDAETKSLVEDRYGIDSARLRKRKSQTLN